MTKNDLKKFSILELRMLESEYAVKASTAPLKDRIHKDLLKIRMAITERQTNPSALNEMSDGI